jgi:hypothetical protein
MTPGRDHRIDFYRGLALLFIFWDHIPHNPWAYLTVRNFGFSDAAEIFVFLAGYAAVMAYGRIARRDGMAIAAFHILRRAWTLYVVHIFVLVMLMGVVFVANQQVDTRDMIQEMNLGYFIGNPQQALVDEMLLRFKPNLMDPLPLYIVLLAGLPLILPLLLRRPGLAVLASVGLYAATLWQGWNIPAHDDGLWYFNPLAWQVLFVVGGALAVRRDHGTPTDDRPLGEQPLFLLLAGWLGVSALLALTWKWPGLHDALMPEWLGQRLYPIDKTNLAPVRLLHFLALAYCVASLVREGPWLQHWSSRHLARMGRHSLEVFCLGVVLAPLADMLNALGGERFSVRLLTPLLGLALMLALANWLVLSRRLGQPARALADQALPASFKRAA